MYCIQWMFWWWWNVSLQCEDASMFYKEKVFKHFWVPWTTHICKFTFLVLLLLSELPTIHFSLKIIPWFILQVLHSFQYIPCVLCDSLAQSVPCCYSIFSSLHLHLHLNELFVPYDFINILILCHQNYSTNTKNYGWVCILASCGGTISTHSLFSVTTTRKENSVSSTTCFDLLKSLSTAVCHKINMSMIFYYLILLSIASNNTW
jgi:hypothetical protein